MDAECTHDGSIKHIQKFEKWGWETLRRRVLDAERTDNLSALQVCNISLKHALRVCNVTNVVSFSPPLMLQLQLLTNGFRLLKFGGFLVYSTCRCGLFEFDSN